MSKILVSACLLGERVRYDGEVFKSLDKTILKWQKEGRVVSVCPEVMGGLSTPRSPAERLGNKIIANDKTDVTEPFHKGARLALELCLKHDINVALLKERSPSCGSSQIYDGSFTGNLVDGVGVTAKLLRENGIMVFSEEQVLEAKQCLDAKAELHV